MPRPQPRKGRHASGGSPRGYAARPPEDAFAGAVEDEWRRFIKRLIPHSTRADKVAIYGRDLVARYLDGGAPRSAADIDRVAGSRVATNLLGRSTWQPEGVALDLAAAAMCRGPEILLANPLSAKRSRDSFCIYTVSALFPDKRAVPVRLRRSYGQADDQHDQVVFDLFNSTVSVASNCGCCAPIVTCDTGLGDYLVQRLAAQDHPFAAQVDPVWWHADICAPDAQIGLGKTPVELFDRPEGVVIHRTTLEGGGEAELVRMTYRDRPDSALFYVRLCDDVCFLVRAPNAARSRVQRQLSDAARLAARASGLREERPLDPLKVDAFHAAEDHQFHWDRHVTVLQAVLNFWHEHGKSTTTTRGT
jgi:hypothetical protein